MMLRRPTTPRSGGRALRAAIGAAALALLCGAAPAAANERTDGIGEAQIERLRRAVTRTHPDLQAASLVRLARGRPRGICGEIERSGSAPAGRVRFWFDDADEVLWPSLLDDTEAGRLNAEMTTILIRIHCG